MPNSVRLPAADRSWARAGLISMRRSFGPTRPSTTLSAARQPAWRDKPADVYSLSPLLGA
jgi:hypothetical protein